MTDHRSSPTPPDDEAAAASFTALLDWASELRFSDLPEDVIRRGLLVLADDIGAMIAVRDDPQIVAVRESLLYDGQPAEATVFGAGRRRGERAAVAAANGVAADWGEMDGGYRPATCHAGLYVLSALLAEAEASGATTQQLLTALVAAYELVTRVARTWVHDELIIHPHALLSPIGAAAGAALGARLAGGEVSAAVCAGATTVMLGPFDHALSGALARNTWTGIAAWTGVQHARWAQAGIGGDPSAPHTAFARAMGATPHVERLTDGLGQTWAIRDGYHKLFACCQYAHSTVEAVLDARTEIGERIDDVVGIDVRTHPLALKLDGVQPRTSLAAKFSVPHTAAAALIRGSHRRRGLRPRRDRRPAHLATAPQRHARAVRAGAATASRPSCVGPGHPRRRHGRGTYLHERDRFSGPTARARHVARREGRGGGRIRAPAVRAGHPPAAGATRPAGAKLERHPRRPPGGVTCQRPTPRATSTPPSTF